jgi:hypothetical protein
MKTFAVLSQYLINNLIICESEELATELTGSPCVEVLDNIKAQIGNYYVNNVFLTQEEYDSYLIEKINQDKEENQRLKDLYNS